MTESYEKDYLRGVCSNLRNAGDFLHIRILDDFRAGRKRVDIPNRLRGGWRGMFSCRGVNNQIRFSPEINKLFGKHLSTVFSLVAASRIRPYTVPFVVVGKPSTAGSYQSDWIAPPH